MNQQKRQKKSTAYNIKWQNLLRHMWTLPETFKLLS